MARLAQAKQRRHARRLGVALVLAGLLVSLSACGDGKLHLDAQSGLPNDPNYRPVATVNASPRYPSQFGHVSLIISQDAFSLDPDQPVHVRLADRACLLSRALDQNRLQCFSQGAARPGRSALDISQGEHSLERFGTVIFEPASDRLFARMAALGGRVAAGVSSGGFGLDSQLKSPPAQIAKLAGADFVLPLLPQTGAPAPPGPEHIDPQSGALKSDYFEDTLRAQLEAEGVTRLGELRLDPAQAVANLARPYFSSATELMENESDNGDLAELVRDFAFEGSFLDALVERGPTLIVSDYAPLDYRAYFERNNLALRQEDVLQELDLFFRRLEAIESEPLLLILNLPPANIEPGKPFSRWSRYETLWLNNALYRAAAQANARAGREWVLIADLFHLFGRMLLASEQITLFGQRFDIEIGVNGENNFLITDAAGRRVRLGFDRFEGLFGLDDRSMTATGQALLANLLIERLNRARAGGGLRPAEIVPVAYVDLAETLAADPLNPHVLTRDAEWGRFSPFAQYSDERALEPLHLAEFCLIDWMPESNPIRSPDDPRCPRRLEPAQTSFTATVGETIDIAIIIRLNEPNRLAGGYPLAVHLSEGAQVLQPVETDGYGRATLSIRLPQTPGLVRVNAACGQARTDIAIQVQQAAR